jgi:DNA invertase Pin-like site-specific DNA recombinase
MSANGSLPTLAPVITNPQVGSVGNSRRKSTSANGTAGRSRHMLIGYARVLHLVPLGGDLRQRGIGLQSSTEASIPPRWRAMFGMLSVLAELQRELIVANTNDGLASARAHGRVGGRRPKLTADQAALAQRLYDEREKTVQQIADMFGVPRSTVYGHLDKTKTVPCQLK